MSVAREIAYIALGSNLNDPVRMVRAGFDALAKLPDTEVIARSSLVKSAPVGYTNQPDFVNAVAAIRTALKPRALLTALLAIEREQGRVREFVNAPRTLDLDILIYGDCVVNEPGLTLPHPQLQERAFVVLPLAQIAPHLMIPARGSIQELLARLDAKSLTRVGEAQP